MEGKKLWDGGVMRLEQTKLSTLRQICSFGGIYKKKLPAKMGSCLIDLEETFDAGKLIVAA